MADLPKSFFQLDVGSDSEASSLPRSLGGVSGPGQSNLSTEVAALIQSEMAATHLRNHRRMLHQHNHQQNHTSGGGVAVNQLSNGHHHENGQRSESPDMDFLEMDFDPGDSESEEAASGSNHVRSNNGPLPSHPPPPPDMESPPVLERPQELRLEVDESEDHFDAEGGDHVAAGAGGFVSSGNGNVSAPMHSPAMDLLPAGGGGMPRSRSLNSPLTSSCNELTSKSHKRRHSGEDGLCTASSSSSTSMSAVEVNMELCGARLSNREAMVFGVPGSSSNVHRAMLKLRMLDQHHPLDQDLDENTNDEVKNFVEKTMIWSEIEACKRQVNQVGVSHCGATALINVLQVSHTTTELYKI